MRVGGKLRCRVWISLLGNYQGNVDNWKYEYLKGRMLIVLVFQNKENYFSMIYVSMKIALADHGLKSI